MAIRCRGMAATLLACTMAVAACVADDAPIDSQRSEPTPSTASPLPWAEEAKIWNTARRDMLIEKGGVAWEYFWDPDVIFDFRPMIPGARVLRGARAFAFMYQLLPAGDPAYAQRDLYFISTSGEVELGRLDWAPSGEDTDDITRLPADIVDILEPMGLNGAERMRSAFSTGAWRERYDREEIPSEAEDVARRWVDAWSVGATTPGMYRNDAQLIDSIGTTILSGADVIADWASDQPDVVWTIGEVRPGSLDVYPLLTDSFDVEGVLMIVSGDDGDGCPGRTAVRLDLDNGQITTETRSREIDDARRCVTESELPDGWWSQQNLNFDEPFFPAEDLETVTGFVPFDGTGIELHNSTEHLEHLVEWAIGRFEAAGLTPPPRLTSITFTQYTDFCSDVRGRAIRWDDQWEIYLCFHEEEACSSDACAYYQLVPKRVVLHELAHPWIAEHVDAETEAAFVELVGLDVWADPDTPWHEQAREHAAETIAWGLLDVPITMLSIGAPTDDALRQQFRLLTGVDPLQPVEAAARG